MNVLVVDDSQTMRTIQRRCLGALGIVNVAEGVDGAHAWQLFQTGSFDLILSDWNMPNMDGLTFLKHVRRVNRQVPFLMITTEAERARVVEAIQAGVTDYLVKPFTPEGLKAKLDKWVGVLS
uniref:Response regulator n=1 Tax=Schlesneria paludicola TaxID=360056 RepID=A0A7C4QQH9_9PLAN